MEELAAQIDVDPANLQATLDRWNKDMTEGGVDTMFGRMTGLAPVEGPYYAFQEGFMNLGAIGGMKINLNCEVQHVNGTSITGLYAAGMASAGWVGPFYPGSGTALLGSIHFGRKAGKIVAGL
jgi:fumarate reductase flavoprotein subunit